MACKDASCKPACVERGNSHPHRRSAPQPVACIIAKAARFPGNCRKAQRPKARPPGAGPLFQSGKEDFKRCGLLSFQSFHPQPANPPQSSGMQARARRAQRRRNGAGPQRVGPHAASAATPPPAAKQAANLEPTQFRILPRRAKGAAPVRSGRAARQSASTSAAEPRRAAPRPPRPSSATCAQAQRLAPRPSSAACAQAQRLAPSPALSRLRTGAAPRPIVRPQPPAHRRSASPRVRPQPPVHWRSASPPQSPASRRGRPRRQKPPPSRASERQRFPRKSTCSRARKCGRMVSTTGSAGNLRRGETSCSTKNTENRIGM